MIRSVFVLQLLAITMNGLDYDENGMHSDQFIRWINEAQDQWKAGRNFHPGSATKNLLSVLPMIEEQLEPGEVEVRKNLPGSFDGRKAWTRCKTVGKVKEQGNCASAWALVAAGVFSDRLCISKVANVEISAQNVLSCCKACGTNCYGGYVTDALNFLSQKGAPTNKCHPYEIYGCPKLETINCPLVRAYNPRCRVYCKQTYKKRKPFQDLRHAGRAYSLTNSSGVIMSEILSRGPVAAVMDVYEDLLVYKSGVYTHTTGSLMAQHPVKIVGWGSRKGTPYWLVVNTWGNMWGDKGYLRLAMDTNGCNLENRVFAISLI